MEKGTDDDRMPCDPTSTRRCSSRTVCVKWATGHGVVDDQTLHGKYATGQKSKSKSIMLKVCTWNVQGLNTAGKLQTIEKEIKNLAVVGIAETHWKTNGHFVSSNGNLIISSSNEHQSINGVGIIVHKQLKDAVLGYNTVDDRIVTVKLQATPINLNIIQVYAPTSKSTQEEIDNFYGKLNETIKNIPNRELLLIIGDFNAKIGDTSQDNHMRNVTGKYGIGKRNERGEMLLDFCAENGLYITNSHFKHHIRRLYTWRSPDGITRNQIDYILIAKRWKSWIRDTKTYPGMDCGSDHNALAAEICIKLRKPIKPKNTTNRWDLDNNLSYRDEVTQNLTNLNLEGSKQMNAEQLWTKFRDTLKEAAEKCKPCREPKKQWISNETWNLIENRKKIKATGLDNENLLVTYNEMTKTINRATRRDKEAFISSICEEIEDHSHKNEPRDLFHKVKQLARKFQPRSLPVRDESGKLLTKESEVIERWQNYCNVLMNEENKSNQIPIQPEQLEPPILRTEVEAALKKLKSRRSAGRDGIVTEMLKATGEVGLDIIHHICNKIWSNGRWPTEWTESVYIPLHKKGAKDVCENHRTIALISHASKIMLYIIQERLKPYLLPQISQEQAGFIPGKGTRDQLVNIRQIIEKCYEFNVPAIFCFLDYSKAFDTVKWDHLWMVLKEMAVPQHLIYLIKTLYYSNNAFVRINNGTSESFTISKGVRQGCVLSPILFNIYGEWIIRKATENWNGGVSIGGQKISNLRYADDTTILTSSEEEMTEILQRIEIYSGEAGLKLNRSKSCILVVDRANTLPQHFENVRDIPRRAEVIYLGARISNTGNCEEEVKRRIGMAKSALFQLTKIWKDHHITKQTKKRLMDSLVFPIATYGSESWTLNAACRRRIEAFEMICYRRMLRIPWTARRTNLSILRELNIDTKQRLLSTIQRHILRFFGHIIRRSGMEKLCIQGKVDGKRRRGRSPVRYIDQIKSLTNLSMTEVMRTAEDRETWRTIINSE